MIVGSREPGRREARRPVRGSRAGAVLLAAALLPAGLVAQGIPVTVGVGAIETGAGAFDLPITVDMSARAEKLGSFVVTLRWNPAVLQFQGGVSGTFGEITVNQDSVAAGLLTLAGANPAGLDALITLGVGRFAVLTSDTTTFRVGVQELYAAGTFADLTGSAVALDRLFCGSLAGRWGDVNGDNAVNGADALIVLTESVGLDVSPFAMGFGDVDSSGVRNPRDALIILSYAVGINTDPFRVGQAVGGAVCAAPGAQTYAVNPASAEALVGQDVSYFAFGLDSTGAALALRNVTWTSSNGTVASIGADGYATVLGGGTTTISALQNDTVIATATLSATAARRTYWVDALAQNARNQLGSPAHPFADLATAVASAGFGGAELDTIRIRPGRYAGARIDRRVAVIGDTIGGGSLPRLVPATPGAAYDTVLVVDGVGHAELRDLLVDTAAIGVVSLATDTLVLRGVEIRGTGAGLAGLRADGARLVHVARSRVIGTPSSQYTLADGIMVLNTDRLVIDTSTVSDFTSDGVYALSVDTIVVRGSTLRRNAGSGLVIWTPDSASAARLTFSRNRVEQNLYGGVTGSYVADAQFDHNVFVGGGYADEGVALTGHRATTAAFLADSFDIRDGGWLALYTFDSLLIDSVRIARTDVYGTDLWDGRVGVLRNSIFANVWDTGLYFGGRGSDTSTFLMRNVSFVGRGGASDYYYYGSGVEADDAVLDVQDGRFSGLYYALSSSSGPVRGRRLSFTDVGYGVYGSCLEGASTLDSVVARRVAYTGAYLYGCGGTSTLTLDVDSLEVEDGESGLEAYGFRRVAVARSRLSQLYQGMYAQGDTVLVDAVDTDIHDDSGIYLAADSLGSVTNSTAACTNQAVGFEIYGPASWTVQANAAGGDCDYGLGLFASRDLVARGNSVGGSGDYGIWSSQTVAGRHRLVGNAVTGSFRNGSVRLYGSTAVRSASVFDSNTVSAGVEAGIYSDLADTLIIRDNTVSGIAPGICCLSYEGGIVVVGQAPTGGGVVDIRRNRLTRNHRGLVLARDFSDSLTAVTVDSNRIVGSDTTGLLVTAYSRILARANLIDSTRAVGVFVDRFSTGAPGDTALVVLSGNNITRNGTYGVYNEDGTGTQSGLIDARNNWWGDVDGPRGAFGNEVSVTGDSVSRGVLWSPWLTAPADEIAPAPPPALLVAAPRAPSGRAPTRAARPSVTTRAVPESDRPTALAPRARAGDDAWATLLAEADRALASRASLRSDRQREREARRDADAARRAELEAAAQARRARPAGEERP